MLDKTGNLTTGTECKNKNRNTASSVGAEVILTSARGDSDSVILDVPLDRPQLVRHILAQLTLEADVDVVVHVAEVLLDARRPEPAVVLAEVAL